MSLASYCYGNKIQHQGIKAIAAKINTEACSMPTGAQNEATLEAYERVRLARIRRQVKE